MLLTSNEIQKILPHRYPFLLIDRVDELEVGKRAVGVKCVSANEAHFMGHFPQKHVMPGVLIIEALAQVGAVSLLTAEENKGKLALFAGIKNAKFRRQVIPGDVLHLEAELIKQKGSIGISKGIARVNGEIACECEIIFAIES
ncbi:MAG TPA: 3-hydroxyacyl-ACP dehydratase FabZ [Acholeplasmataceae bacterium]|jgi:3-hydroxyacyl-[acyl-carrier-protein] dehydratase|nr:3-hydroxyacyl-ACP dehydratase FabZ [Acholeplasmataceae bacterium]